MERSASGTFLVFAAACALGYVWSTFFVPETANVSLEEMDAVFGSSAGREDVALKRQVRFCLFARLGCFLVADVLSISKIEDDLGLHDLVGRWAHGSDRKSTRLNSSHSGESRMPSSA